MGKEARGFSGRSIPVLGRLVASSLHYGMFEYVMKLFYPDGMDEEAKRSVLTAINHNISMNRRDYYLRKYGIDITSSCVIGLNNLPGDEIIVARREIHFINQRFNKAREFIESNYKEQ
jgi:hypothetical protein